MTECGVAPAFEREMACTEAEWLGWLPAALAEWPWQLHGAWLKVQIGQGWLDVRWHAGEPRRIALLSLPRLWVRFEFTAVEPGARVAFMKRFDLYTRRGGG